jgi:DNA polymerase-3 subunit gamma/tau
MVARTAGKPERLMDLPAGEIQRIVAQSNGVSPSHLSQITDILIQEESALRFSSLPRIALEVALIRTLEVVPALPIEALIEKLDALKNEMAAMDPGTAPPADGFPEASAPSETPASMPGKTNRSQDDALPDSTSGPGPAVPAPAAASCSEDPWEQVVQVISEKTPSLAASLSKCKRVRETESELEIEVHGNGYDFQALNRKKNKTTLAKACRAVYGRAMTVYFVRPEEDTPRETEKPKPKNHLKNEAVQHPLVADAIRIFGGKVVDVKIL